MKSEWILHGLFPLAIAWVLIVVYFRIADRFNIIDKPNERSSHKQITLRGAGIIFPLGFLCGTLLSAFTGQLPPVGLIAGLLAIAAVSFADDVTGLPGRIRIIVQILGVACLLASAGVYQQSLWIVLAAFIVIIGTINAYNFMDGINGITALYSLVSLITLRILIPDPLLNWLIAAVLVFSFYNLRTKARCFSGDVGSVSMAFILCYYILKLCIETGNIQWILLLGVYGIDSVFTIVFRMLRKENIFKAHRSH
ncbi:MAG TPA: UDP-GlcNAc--UDP-phosphate GlcNAc-1-phosphate transferase, partial [Chitinophagaceae bacterium]|nr:UDP-GlcNAc--UDP-phosphate GlcNAc-1-phosphate transferase [Chitinophagaceae bacterium]